MSAFKKWFESTEGHGTESADAEKAFNAGLERAAEIVEGAKCGANANDHYSDRIYDAALSQATRLIRAEKEV